MTSRYATAASARLRRPALGNGYRGVPRATARHMTASMATSSRHEPMAATAPPPGSSVGASDVTCRHSRKSQGISGRSMSCTFRMCRVTVKSIAAATRAPEIPTRFVTAHSRPVTAEMTPTLRSME